MSEKQQLCLRTYRDCANKSNSALKDITKSYPLSSTRKKQSYFLVNFLNWLKKQINSNNKNFALDAQNYLLYKPSQTGTQFIFILPEVFEQYYHHSGIPAQLIQSVLKKKLKLTFIYTIVRDEKVIEVFPCKKFF